ncbi:hypothetical protein ACR6K9_000766 [Enterococcus faecalis]|uniref:hypothetical protein n=1 Tax=Enterococcus faecalis TaxID=1351 RepID=UPI00032FE849|nr:hypothetical protein [Enterococcus faecalis]EGO5261433.1 hypothetical protein [Enterococcus faecalis]EHM3137982.1 hypothetical protein [Enterococcus faecalis]EOG90382.1 hypothetical protein SQ3_02599 [Enterococcus faecalis EnGen0212]EOI86881.1 hypothetical protein UKY_02638 [Enterococcus faecalis EnGen0294]NRC82852.1 hypothetical protein [Enterococcus faecalis]
MEIKISIHLKSRKVISYLELDIDQGTIDRWLDGLLDDENEWISIGDLPSMSLIPIKAIECINFEEVTQPIEREQEEE